MNGHYPMRRKKSIAPIIILLVLSVAVLCGGALSYNHFNNEVLAYERSIAYSEAFFQSHSPLPFINNAVQTEPYVHYNPHDDALYFFEAPEGFTIISHSTQWNHEMLELLYHELLKNEHGDEINLLYEVIINPQEEEEFLATYNLGTKAVSFFIQFPAFPPDFTIDFPKDIGSINLYGGDTKTTIESMAGSLSHEYGHLYTFYYMFDNDMGEGDTIGNTEYARLRDAENLDLITSAAPGESYAMERFRYLIEIAAEDYVQLMGSPTTRQVVDFVDVQQILNGAEQPTDISSARNAFPQENMMIPLAGDVPGLSDYFYSFIDTQPRRPIEERQEITLQIQTSVIQHNLVTGLRTFVYYTITWNAPYQNAVYTLVCYDPDDYIGWGFPIKTVHPGQNTSAVVGEYVIDRGDRVTSLDDGIAHGVKIFYVAALLPDGTFYISDKLEFDFE